MMNTYPVRTGRASTYRPMAPRSRFHALGGCLALIVAAGSLSAQSADSSAADDENVIVLSPFQVDATDQQGYTVKSTTSGNRLRTDLRDVGAQIDVFSKDFLDDIAASDPEEAFLYSLNIENEQENPDYGDGSRARFERAGPAATARGLGNSRTTGITTGRNFFDTQVRLHTYNTENLAISSGPNSILFGLGQAGGTISASLKQAETHRNTRHLGLKFDSHGTRMGYFDINQVLIEDKLAVRAAALLNREESYMKGNFDNQDRFYGTVTWKVSDKVNLRLHYEDIDEDESPTQYRMFQDNISPWLIDGNMQGYDPDRDGARPRYLNNASGREAVLIRADGSIDLDTVGITKWNNRYGARSDETHDYVEYVSENGVTNSFFYDPNFLDSLDDRRVTFSPETLERLGLPFKDVNPWGETMRRTRQGDIFTAFLEVNPLENLFIEFGYNEEEMDQRQFGYNRSFNYGVFVDAQEKLPDGTSNPNFGNLFMQDEGWGWETPTREKEARMVASYELDLTEKTDSKLWSALLGDHRLAGMYSQRETSEIRANSFQIWQNGSDGSIPSFLAGAATRVNDPNASWIRTGDRRVSTRQYLLPENGYQLQIIPGAAPGDNLVINDPGNSGVTIAGTMWDPLIGSNRLFSFDREVESRMFAYQGYFWEDRLILTYGRREDELRERVLRGAGDRANNYTEAEWAAGVPPSWVIPGGYFPWYTELEWDTFGPWGENVNDTKGLVFRPTGLADWLTVFYNESGNNSAGAVRFDADGSRHDPITGVGKDYGVRFDLFDNRLSFKINQYETDSKNVETGGGSVDGNVRGVFNNLENRYYDVNPNGYSTNGFDIFGQTDLFLPVADKTSEGTEFTIIAQPTRGWNVRFTAAKTESVLDNIAKTYIEWGDARQSFWQNIEWNLEDLDGEYKPVTDWWPDPEVGDGPTYEQLIAGGFTRTDPTTGMLEVDDNGDVVAYRTKLGAPGVDQPLSGWENVGYSDGANNETYQEYWERNYLVNVKSRIEQLNGVSAPNVRKWRMNLSTSYSFQEGRMKGWRIGGSVRYRDAGVIGYSRKTVGTGADQITVLDLSNPYLNDDEIFVDAMVAYRGKIFERDYRIQLNVRNLLDNSDLYPTDASTTGRNLVWAGYEPRTYIMSFDIDF
ncbi:MAG: hypothetical protein SynsKO_36160 [Synoicihabitans sp.]